jgi:transposase-like protein
VRVKGAWKYLYRAVDKAGATVDVLLTGKRDRKAALGFLRKAIWHNGTTEKSTIDKSGAHTAAIESHNTENKAGIAIRQVKYLNNIVEQDHRAIKRQTRPMLGFKTVATPPRLARAHQVSVAVSRITSSRWATPRSRSGLLYAYSRSTFKRRGVSRGRPSRYAGPSLRNLAKRDDASVCVRTHSFVLVL